MVETTDGFRIAEVDLKLRGPGKFYGTKQSGLLRLRIANITGDTEILDLARAEAFALVARNPELAAKRGPDQSPHEGHEDTEGGR
jgi:ATP-dependent DNA helicase RecG